MSKPKKKPDHILFDKFYKRKYGSIPKNLESYEYEQYKELLSVYCAGFKSGQKTLLQEQEEKWG